MLTHDFENLGDIFRFVKRAIDSDDRHLIYFSRLSQRQTKRIARFLGENFQFIYFTKDAGTAMFYRNVVLYFPNEESEDISGVTDLVYFRPWRD